MYLGSYFEPGGSLVVSSGYASPAAGTYCTDEDLALRCREDWLSVCPRSQVMAAGADGVFALGSLWTFTSASQDFGAQGVVAGGVAALTGPRTAPFYNTGSGELFAVAGVSGHSLSLRRLGKPAGQGAPPVTSAGLSSVEFRVVTLTPQIGEVSFDVEHFFGISVPGRPERDRSQLYDPTELREYTVLTTLRRAYVAASTVKGADFAAKLALITSDLGELTARLRLRWGTDGDTQPTTSVYAGRVRR
jgi:hypothetical protein